MQNFSLERALRQGPNKSTFQVNEPTVNDSKPKTETSVETPKAEKAAQPSAITQARQANKRAFEGRAIQPAGRRATSSRLVEAPKPKFNQTETKPNSLLEVSNIDTQKHIISGSKQPVLVVSFPVRDAKDQPNWNAYKRQMRQTYQATEGQNVTDDLAQISNYTTDRHAAPITPQALSEFNLAQAQVLLDFVKQPEKKTQASMAIISLPVKVEWQTQTKDKKSAKESSTLPMAYQARGLASQSESFSISLLVKKDPATQELQYLVAAGSTAEIVRFSHEQDTLNSELAWLDVVGEQEHPLTVVNLMCERLTAASEHGYGFSVAFNQVRAAMELAHRLFSAEARAETNPSKMLAANSEVLPPLEKFSIRKLYDHYLSMVEDSPFIAGILLDALVKVVFPADPDNQFGQLDEQEKYFLNQLGIAKL